MCEVLFSPLDFLPMPSERSIADQFIALSKAQNDAVIDAIKDVGEAVNRSNESVESAVKKLYLLLACALFVTSSGYFFYIDKIPFWVWAPMQLAMMVTYFGEGMKIAVPLMGGRGTMKE